MSLLEIGNLSELNELLPEAVARGRSVLIIANVGNKLTLASPKNAVDDEDRKCVEYIMDRPLLWVSHGLDDIRTAIDVAYGTIRKVKGCGWKFATQCPERWENLEPTKSGTVRNCGVCNKLVHLCLSDSEVKEHAKLGNCVCYVANELEGESLGDVILQQFDSDSIDFTDDVDTSDSDAE